MPTTQDTTDELQSVEPVRRRGRPSTRPSEEAIYAGALEAFAADGFAGASMRDIAARAGTSLSNLYNYVPSKEQLLAALLAHANDGLLERLRADDDADADPAERLRRLVRGYTYWTVDNRLAGLVAVTEVRYLRGEERAAVVAARDTTQALFAQVVDAGVASGVFTTAHPRGAVRALVLLCSAMATWYRPDGSRTPNELADEQAALALDLVGAGSHRGG